MNKRLIIACTLFSLWAIYFLFLPAFTFGANSIRAIEAQNAKYIEAYNGKDAAGVAALHTKDAIIYPPNQHIVKGRQAIQNAIAAEIQGGARDLTFTTLELDGSGDLAYEVGQYTLTFEPQGQKALQDTGKYLVLWKRQGGGEWLIDKDIWDKKK